MSSLKKIICLANSWKKGERCIAGIDLDTGKWVRPVCDDLYPQDGRIPQSIRLINSKEPNLLDILEIPLANTGNNFGFESENLSVLAGQWKCSAQARTEDLPKYCHNSTSILHNGRKYVYPSDLQRLPFAERRTLQLVHVESFSAEESINSEGKPEWRGSIHSVNGHTLKGAKITDPVFVKKLNAGYQALTINNCFVTVSLSLPWAHENWEGEAPCWKLIAGVIEI